MLHGYTPMPKGDGYTFDRKWMRLKQERLDSELLRPLMPYKRNGANRTQGTVCSKRKKKGLSPLCPKRG